VTIYRSPSRNLRDLKIHGPRLKITIGHPILNPTTGPSSAPQRSGLRFTETDALIDTGAQRTVLAPEAVERVGLSKINEAELRVVGTIVKADVYVASLQFPRCGLRTIEVIEVSCCELPHPLYRCLLGRDVLSRWIFHYDGPVGTWHIVEDAVSSWVEPPEGIDPDLWGR
jgi:predicted aspartyl protease